MKHNLIRLAALALLASGISLQAQAPGGPDAAPPPPPRMGGGPMGPGGFELPAIPQEALAGLSEEQLAELAELREMAAAMRAKWEKELAAAGGEVTPALRREFFRENRKELKALRDKYQKLAPEIDALREHMRQQAQQAREVSQLMGPPPGGAMGRGVSPGAGGPGPGAPGGGRPGAGPMGSGPGPHAGGQGPQGPMAQGVGPGPQGAGPGLGPQRPMAGPPGAGQRGPMPGDRMERRTEMLAKLATHAQAMMALRAAMSAEVAARINAQKGELDATALREIRRQVFLSYKDQLDALHREREEIRRVFMERRSPLPPPEDMPPELLEFHEAVSDVREEAWMDRQILRESVYQALAIEDPQARQAELKRIREEFRLSQQRRREALREARENLAP